MNDFPKEYLFTDKHVWIHKLKMEEFKSDLPITFFLGWDFARKSSFHVLGRR